MFSVHAVRKRTSAELHASGDLVLENVRAFVDAILGVVEKKSILLDLTKVERVDLAGLQTLYALKRGEEESGYSVSFRFGDNRERIERITGFAGLRMIDSGESDGETQQ